MSFIVSWIYAIALFYVITNFKIIAYRYKKDIERLCANYHTK